MIPESEENLYKNTLYSNYKPEFVAACIVESGFETDEVRLIRQGVNRGGKSIDKICREYSRSNFSQFLNVYARKRGLYDSLPEGLFHQRMDIRDKKNKTNVVESFKKEREVELNARFFFSPFEISIDRMLINAQLYEMRLEKQNKYDDFVRLWSSNWAFLRGLPLNKSLFLIGLLSQVYRLTTPEQVSAALSSILDCQVDIHITYKSLRLETDCNWVLGSNLLAVDSVIGEEIEDYFPVMEVNINGLHRNQKNLVLEGTAAHKQFMELLDLFVPADAEVVFNTTVAPEDSMFFLSDLPELAPVLGLTSTLS